MLDILDEFMMLKVGCVDAHGLNIRNYSHVVFCMKQKFSQIIEAKINSVNGLKLVSYL